MKLGHRHAEFDRGGFDGQLVAAHPADLCRRNTHQPRALDHLHRVQRLARDDHAALRLAKQQRVQSQRGGVSAERRTLFNGLISGVLPRRRHSAQIHRRPDQPWRFARDKLGDATFRQADRQTAFAAIMRAFHQAALNQAEQRCMQGLGGFEIAPRRRAGFLTVNHLQICRAAQTE